MAHFTRERIDRDWYRGLPVPHTVIRNIDEKTKKAVSRTGGTWTPSSAITIAGAGLELQGLLDLSTHGSKAFPGSGKNFIFGDDDYFRFDTPLSKSIDDTPLLLLGNYTYTREAIPWMNVANTTTPALRTKRPGAFLRVPIRIPDGARLASVEISWAVGQSHSNVPASLPQARVVRISADGTIEKYPDQTDATHDPNGWVSPTRPASGALYTNSNNIQTFTLTYDSTDGERADRSLYSYAVEWIDESGTNAFDPAAGDIGNYLVHLILSVKIPDLKPY